MTALVDRENRLEVREVARKRMMAVLLLLCVCCVSFSYYCPVFQYRTTANLPTQHRQVCTCCCTWLQWSRLSSPRSLTKMCFCSISQSKLHHTPLTSHHLRRATPMSRGETIHSTGTHRTARYTHRFFFVPLLALLTMYQPDVCCWRCRSEPR